MAVPVIESFTSATGVSNTGGATVSKPSGVTAGDLLLIFVSSDDTAANIAFTGLTGWNTLFADVGDSSTDVHIGVFYRIADGTEGSSETVNDNQSSSNNEIGAFYLRISGTTTNSSFVIGASSSYVNGSATNFVRPDFASPYPDTDALAFGVVGYDGADGTVGTDANSTYWSDANNDNALSNASLLASGRMLEMGSGASGSTLAWSYAEFPTTVSANALGGSEWEATLGDGWSQVQFLVFAAGVEVSGNVTLSGSPVSGAPIVAISAEDNDMTNATVMQVTSTDVNGDYSVSYLTSGAQTTSVIYCVYDNGSNTYTAPLHVIWS